MSFSDLHREFYNQYVVTIFFSYSVYCPVFTEIHIYVVHIFVFSSYIFHDFYKRSNKFLATIILSTHLHDTIGTHFMGNAFQGRPSIFLCYSEQAEPTLHWKYASLTSACYHKISLPLLKFKIQIVVYFDELRRIYK